MKRRLLLLAGHAALFAVVLMVTYNGLRFLFGPH